MANEPLIRLEPGGKAPILSYNLPEPAIYYGDNFIELEYDDDVFTEAARERPDVPVPEPVPVPSPPRGEEEEIHPPPGDDEEDEETAPDHPPPSDGKDRPTPTPSPPGDRDDITPTPRPSPPRDRDEGTIRPLDSSETDRPREKVRVRDHRSRIDAATLSDEELEQEIKHSMKSGFADEHVLPNARVRSGKLRFTENSGLELETDLPVSEELRSLDLEEVLEMKKEGDIQDQLDRHEQQEKVYRRFLLGELYSDVPAFLPPHDDIEDLYGL